MRLPLRGLLDNSNAYTNGRLVLMIQSLYSKSFTNSSSGLAPPRLSRKVPTWYPNGFLEMELAFALDKKIFLLNAVPDQPNNEEMLGLNPIELHGDLTMI